MRQKKKSTIKKRQSIKQGTELISDRGNKSRHGHLVKQARSPMISFFGRRKKKTLSSGLKRSAVEELNELDLSMMFHENELEMIAG